MPHTHMLHPHTCSSVLTCIKNFGVQSTLCKSNGTAESGGLVTAAAVVVAVVRMGPQATPQQQANRVTLLYV